MHFLDLHRQGSSRELCGFEKIVVVPLHASRRWNAELTRSFFLFFFHHHHVHTQRRWDSKLRFHMSRTLLNYWSCADSPERSAIVESMKFSQSQRNALCAHVERGGKLECAVSGRLWERKFLFLPRARVMREHEKNMKNFVFGNKNVLKKNRVNIYMLLAVS